MVETEPKDAQIFIDGLRFLGADLPYGQHDLWVDRDGFKPMRQAITLSTGHTAHYTFRLWPTEARQQREAQATSRRRAIGYVSGAGGAAFVVGGIALLSWNSTRYADWQANQTHEPLGNQLQTVSSIQRFDDLALGSVVLGTGLLAAGAWLLLTNPTPGD